MLDSIKATPLEVSSFLFIVDLALLQLHEPGLFQSSDYKNLTKHAQPRLDQSSLAASDNALERSMHVFWQQYLQSITLPEANKFHVALALTRPDTAPETPGNTSLFHQLLTAFRSPTGPTVTRPEYLRVAEATGAVKAPGPWTVTGTAVTQLTQLARAADKAILQQTLAELMTSDRGAGVASGVGALLAAKGGAGGSRSGSRSGSVKGSDTGSKKDRYRVDPP